MPVFYLAAVLNKIIQWPCNANTDQHLMQFIHVINTIRGYTLISLPQAAGFNEIKLQALLSKYRLEK
jgi:hypothetical protein